LTDNPGPDEIDVKDLAIEKPKATQRSNGESATVSSSRSGNAEKEYSLANQYLDTMIMDDVWRAACRKRIRQLQRKQRELKRLTFTAPKPLARISKTLVSRHPKLAHKKRSFFPVKSKPAIKSTIKYKTVLPTPPLSPKYRSKPSSPRRSDSGYISSSPTFTPTPPPPNYLRVRSTRNCPITPTTTTISIDIPASMIGRSCLSCGCTNTTCWRRTLGGIICNSCGLRYPTHKCEVNDRYKKCGIICADAKCRYIPTRSEIRELKSQGVRGGGHCYACKGDVIVDDGR
jgi:hypothetical protein